MGSWFENVFGIPERSYEETQKKFTYDAKSGKLTAEGNKTFDAGKFENLSVGDLRKKCNLDDAYKGRLTVEELVGDVSGLHVESENMYAVFQAASQFNCLEHTSQRGTPEQGITCYAHDRTQGPACAIACAPGTVVRNYFAFHSIHEDPEKGGQTEDKQVKNLEEVEKLLDNASKGYFTVQNGYTLAKSSDLMKMHDVVKEKQEEIVEKLRIGVQWDTQAVCSQFGRAMHKEHQIVTQCYCSAVSVSYSGCSDAAWEPLAKLVLKAAYEATLYAAVMNAKKHEGKQGSKKVFLTSLGGGVFGNPMSWITEAMSCAFEKFDDCDLQVYIVSFGRKDPNFKEICEKWKP